MVDLRWGRGVCCGMLGSALWLLFYLHRYVVLRGHEGCGVCCFRVWFAA